MKHSWAIPRIIKVIHESQLQEFTAKSVSEMWNSKYRNSISSIQVGQIMTRNPDHFTISEYGNVFHWRLKGEGF